MANLNLDMILMIIVVHTANRVTHVVTAVALARAVHTYPVEIQMHQIVDIAPSHSGEYGLKAALLFNIKYNYKLNLIYQNSQTIYFKCSKMLQNKFLPSSFHDQRSSCLC